MHAVAFISIQTNVTDLANSNSYQKLSFFITIRCDP